MEAFKVFLYRNLGIGVVAVIEDADGAVRQAVRDQVGPDVPLMSVHDLHCNLTEAMIDPADALSVMRTYPHVDMRERALHVTGLMEETLAGRLRPTMAFRQLPLLWSAPRMIDAEPPIPLAHPDFRPKSSSINFSIGASKER